MAWGDLHVGALGRQLSFTTGSFRPILLKKSVLPDCILIAENAFFARRYAKSEPGILCSM